MLKRLLKKRSRPNHRLALASVPEGKRIYAIGDVHGRNDLLQLLLHQILADNASLPPADCEIIFLGDLIDRGPESAQVIDTVIQLKQRFPSVRCLMGNHEEIYLAAATGDVKSVRFFCRIGGRETILSYNITLREYNELDIDSLAARLPSLFPQEHIDFVKSFEEQIIIGDYAFVHAGIKPGISLAEQQPKHLRWIREDFIDDDSDHEKIIVFGHTISENVVEMHNRIGIDTGAYESGKLTALVLEGSERRYLDTMKNIGAA